MFAMNREIKEAFNLIKPVCDVVMVCPSPDTIAAFTSRVSELKKEVVQELQQYLLFPFITHIKSTEITKKHELQCWLIDAMRVVVERVTVNSLEMCLKIETALLQLVFDNTKPRMRDVPEELKLSVMRTLTVLVLNLDKRFRERLIRTQMPLLAQVIFVAVHLAKLEKMRALRISAIDCLTAHTSTHAQLTNKKYHLMNPNLDKAVVEMLSNILPGVLAALQDVATCPDNPGHALIVASIDATHRILCTVMHDKNLEKRDEVTAADIARMVRDKAKKAETEVSSKEIPKDVPKRSPEWYAMAGDKLTVITKSLAPLRTHEHWRVRKELAIYCRRVLEECHRSMPLSVPIALDILISLCKDEYVAVSEFCTAAVTAYFSSTNKHTAMDGLCENLMAALNVLPRVMNNIDSSRKLSALGLVHGYVQIMSDDSRPQRLTSALSVRARADTLCAALLQAAGVLADVTLMTHHCVRDVSSPPPTTSPWLRLRHCDTPQCEKILRDICAMLSAAECAELLLDRMLELFQAERSCEHVCLMNWMVAGENSPESLSRRVLDTYISSEVWQLPLEVASSDAPLTSQDTLDVTVYNPRAWHKESVPDLYEGATETRYTDISYQTPRPPPREPDTCATLKQAQHNMALSCLLTEGVGIAARRLGDKYQPYLLKTLCLLLERVGSKYEMLHLAGLKAINDVAVACAHASVADLIRCNADYFTSQVTLRLKKAWNSESALQILSVVMEYSDASILDCLYGIVEDVLVQSCDKYYERNLRSYLQVFVTFIECIRRWFPLAEATDNKSSSFELDLFKDVTEFIKNKEEAERLMSDEEFERSTGMSVEEMYREDVKKKEEDFLDYNNTVTEEKQPLPQHVKVTVTILKRCIHFVPSRRRPEAILAMRVLTNALPILEEYENELLPLVHLSWSPLVAVTSSSEPVVLTRALELFLVMAALAKDFILSRAVKEVLPHIYKFIHTSSVASYRQDARAAYRGSAAFRVQRAALGALPRLAAELALRGAPLEEAMGCVDAYLSNKQPKPLQILAVDFFKKMLVYDYGAAWYHLRSLCGNDQVLEPPDTQPVKLDTIVGTPYEAVNTDYDANIKLIFNNALS